jgi:hypothetical protein
MKLIRKFVLHFQLAVHLQDSGDDEILGVPAPEAPQASVAELSKTNPRLAGLMSSALLASSAGFYLMIIAPDTVKVVGERLSSQLSLREAKTSRLRPKFMLRLLYTCLVHFAVQAKCCSASIIIKRRRDRNAASCPKDSRDVKT